MKRKLYLISYDISDSKRLQRVARLMEGYGYRIQFSVFQCPLSELKLQKLKADVHQIIKTDDDQVLIICLGPDSEQTSQRFESIGRPYRSTDKVTII